MFQAHLLEQHFLNLTSKFTSSLIADKKELNVELDEEIYNETYDPDVDSVAIRYKLHLVSSDDDESTYQTKERYQFRILLFLPKMYLNEKDRLFVMNSYIEYLKNGFKLEDGHALVLDKKIVAEYKQKYPQVLSLINVSDLELNNTVIPKVYTTSSEKYTETDVVVSYDMTIDLEVTTIKFNRG